MPRGRKLKIERPTFAKAVAEVIKPRLTKLISDTMFRHMQAGRNLEPICIPICGHALRPISKSLVNNHTLLWVGRTLPPPRTEYLTRLVFLIFLLCKFFR